MANHLAERIWEHFANDIVSANTLTERTTERKEEIFSKLARFLIEVSTSVPLAEVNYTVHVWLYHDV